MSSERVEMKYRLKEALELREKKPADLVRDLKIPKSAVSQYLSGRSQNMDSERMHAICKYLNVSEPWMMGYNVIMEREVQKNNDTITDIVVRMRMDSDFMSVVEDLHSLDETKFAAVRQMLSAFLK